MDQKKEKPKIDWSSISQQHPFFYYTILYGQANVLPHAVMMQLFNTAIWIYEELKTYCSEPRSPHRTLYLAARQCAPTGPLLPQGQYSGLTFFCSKSSKSGVKSDQAASSSSLRINSLLSPSIASSRSLSQASGISFAYLHYKGQNDWL